MPRQSAVTLFGEWAKLGKDEGMESGHSPSVEQMIASEIWLKVTFDILFLNLSMKITLIFLFHREQLAI